MSPGAAPLPNARPDAAERFARDLTALVTAPAPDRPLALAVSGGPDSMAMLALAAAAFPGCVIAATVDHRLRADATAEAAMVADWCRSAGIAHATLAPDRPPAGASIQAQARHVRYALLGDWALARGASALATAHHADDQAETFLMRAARGSGPAGLAGIRPRWAFRAERWEAGAREPAAQRRTATDTHTLPAPRMLFDPQTQPDDQGPPRPQASSHSVERAPLPWGDTGLRRGNVIAGEDATAPGNATLPVVRPLLTWRRAELRAVAASLPFVDDPSNADPRYDRTAVRALLAASSIDPVALSAAAAHCREADAALAETADWLWRIRAVSDDAGCTLDAADLPRELRRRLVRRAIGDVRRRAAVTEGHWSDAVNIEPLLDALSIGTGATQAGILASAIGIRWSFRPAPPRRSP